MQSLMFKGTLGSSATGCVLLLCCFLRPAALGQFRFLLIMRFPGSMCSIRAFRWRKKGCAQARVPECLRKDEKVASYMDPIGAPCCKFHLHNQLIRLSKLDPSGAL